MTEQRIALVVEDNPEDFEAIRRAFRGTGIECSLFHCANGDDALDYLYRRGKHSSAEGAIRPTLILLDLNLPGTSGLEVLETIKSDDDLRLTPVVVLTTSSNEGDIQTCYQLGANSYMQKPVELKAFMVTILRLAEYWLETVILPVDPLHSIDGYRR